MGAARSLQPPILDSDPGTQPSLGWMCRLAGTARSLAGVLWANVPPVLWYFRGRGPDHARFRISANRCAILHPEPTHLMALSTLPQTCRQGSHRAPVDESPGRSVWPPDPGPCHFKRETAGPWVGSRLGCQSGHHRSLRPPPLILGCLLGTVLYISARAFPSSTLVSLHMGRLVNPDV